MSFNITSWLPRRQYPSRNFGQEWRSLRNDMERLMEGFPMMEGSGGSSGMELEFSPRCGMEETDQQYLLSFDLPGMSKDEVKIEVHGNRLRIWGERKKEHREEKKGYQSEERFYGRFEREFQLPTDTDGSKIVASYDNGVLHLAIPKSESTKAFQVPIKEGAMLGKSASQEKATKETKPSAKSAA